ncbi:hypothetical protein [Gemmatimonas aurantiaca]|uniref:hypothetical protein n=1 Tax=Gemmatimonas aurantiaca TaxID=173480 RepID=UPI00301B87C5
MKINSGNTFPYATRLSAYNATTTTRDASFASALASAATSTPDVSSVSSGDLRRADFTDMTRQDLREWVNAQIRSGQMTLDESTPFVGMTIALPVNGDFAAAERAMREDRVDFLALTRAGIEGAYWRHDDQAAARLESALQIMQRAQGRTTGIDTRV